MANPNDDPRSHIRLRFIEGLKAELRLLNPQGVQLTSSTSTVLLLNMSQDGLCFLSGLQLPVQHNYMVELRMQLAKTHLIVRGRIVWCSKHDNQYQHGVRFECSDTLKSLIVGAMNEELLARQPQQRKIHQLYNRLLHKNKYYFGG